MTCRIHHAFLNAFMIVFAVLALAATFCRAAELRFSASLPLSSAGDGPTARAVAAYLQIHASDLNTQLAIPNGHNLSLTILDSAGSLSRAVANVFTSAQSGSLAMIGDLSSDLTIPTALAAQQNGLYLCSGSATASKLSNPIEFPSFFRTTQSDATQALALAYFIKHMKWSACAVFASSSQYGRSIARGFLQSAQEVGVEVVAAEHIPFRGSMPDRDKAMARALGLAAKSGIRIFVFLGTGAEYVQLAQAARGVGLVGPEAVWIGSDGVAPLSLSAESDASVKEITQGLLYLFPREIANKEQAQWLVERAQSKLPTASGPARVMMDPYAAGFCDCLGALAVTFVNKFKSDAPNPVLSSPDLDIDVIPSNPTSRITPVAQLLQPFQGLAGQVVFNSENSLEKPFVVHNMFDGVASEVFTIDPTSGSVDSIAPPRYFSGTLNRPLERPSWIISFVRYFSLNGWIVLVVSGLLAVAVVACSILVIVHHKTVYVREHSLPVLLFVALGLLLLLCSPISWLDQQTAVTCNVGVWVSGVGTQFIVLPLLYRTFQTWRACENIMLWKRPISNAFVTLVITLTLFVIDLAFLFSWTYLAPLQPTVQSSPTHFSFTCISANSPVAHHLLTAAHIAWNLSLIWSLGFFTNATRWLRTPARSQHYTHFIAVNLALCAGVGIVVTVLVRFASFALAMFWIYTLLVWYVVAFTLGLLHVCVLQQVRQGPPDAAGDVADASDPLYSLLAQRYGTLAGRGGSGAGTSLKSFEPSGFAPGGFAGGLPTSATTGAARAADGVLLPLPGKPSSLVGDFAIKFPRILSTWTLHRVVVSLDEGYLGVMKKLGGVEETDVGHVWRLSDLASRLVPYMELVLEVSFAGEPIMFVQLSDEGQVEDMVRMMPDSTL